MRLATLSDGRELARLRWQFTAENRPSVAPLAAFEPEFLAFLSAALDSGRWAVWVAELDDRLMGTLSVELIDRVPRPYTTDPRKCYLTSAYVEPGFRNHGIGRALLDAAVAWAAENGASGCIVWPTRDSVRFYNRAGFMSSDVLERRPGS